MRLRLEDMPLGARLAVLVDHEPAVRNIPRSAREWGQEIESAALGAPGLWQIIVRKRVP
jgi:tRNA 2-thiouridine synthesizing protein A